MNPKLSIITINYNNAEGLRRTIKSIVNQSFKQFEYLVIDGGSTDNSTDVIRQYSEQISYWSSEPDAGIYNAMNKGIKQAKGEYLLFMNSGDELSGDTTLTRIFEHLNETDIVYFDILLQHPSGHSEVKKCPNVLTFSYFVLHTIPHQSAFIRKELFDKHGLYDETLRIVSDWAFFINVIFKFNASYKHISDTFSIYHLDGISSDTSNIEKIAAEKRAVLMKDFTAYASLFDELTEAAQLKQHFESSRIIRFAKWFGFFS
jgi:glycosyltransferase involved in cell wall biosynthesis